jgi:hypothetical protein
MAERSQKSAPTTGSGRVNPRTAGMVPSQQGQVQACTDDLGGSKDVSSSCSTAIYKHSDVPTPQNVAGSAPQKKRRRSAQDACTTRLGDPRGTNEPH